MGGAVRAADNDKLDKKAVDVVKQVGELYKNAKSLHAEMALELNAERDGQTRTVESEAAFDIKQPNQFALRSHRKEDKEAGISVVCDGKSLFICPTRMKQYTEAGAPDDLRKMGMTLARLGQPNTGMLFVNLLTEDPAGQLLEGVNSCTYAGKEKIGDVQAHHLKFSQEEFDWELWVAAEGKPFVLKMATKRSADDGKFTLVETYRNWKLDGEPGKDTFSFSAPKDAKKVDKFPGNGDGN
jgi:hypothetical protein